MQHFLFGTQAEAMQGMPSRPFLQLLESRIRVLGDQSGQASPVREAQSPLSASIMSFRGQRAGLAPWLQHSIHEREADAEPLGDLALGAFPCVDGRRNPLTEIHRVMPHDHPFVSNPSTTGS
jgi:hypothetical protein